MRAIVFLLLFCGVAQAAQVSDLYLGKVEVASRSNADRNAGSRDALEQVLIRVTGNPQVRQLPEAQPILRQVQQAVLSYGYEGDSPLMLEVRFDDSQIKRQLQAANLPIWGAQRPQTLVWLATEVNGQRLLVSDQDLLAETLNAQAQQKGLPLALPLMDLEDSMVVSINDVWGNFPGPVAEASQRYDMDFYVSAVVSPDMDGQQAAPSLPAQSEQEADGAAQQWRYQVNLYKPQPADEFGVQRSLVRRAGVADSQEAAISAMLGEVSLYYAGRYAALSTGTDDGRSTLNVTLTGGIEQVVSLERYLLSLAPVQNLTIEKVRGKELVLELELLGSMDEVEQLISLEPRMEIIEDPAGEPAAPGQDPFDLNTVAPVGQELAESSRYLWRDR